VEVDLSLRRCGMSTTHVNDDNGDRTSSRFHYSAITGIRLGVQSCSASMNVQSLSPSKLGSLLMKVGDRALNVLLL